MIAQSEINDLIGTEVNVISEDGNFCEKITIKDIFLNSKGEAKIVDKFNRTYDEDELDWHYTLTLGGIMMSWLNKHGYVSDDAMFNKSAEDYENELRDLMETMIKSGYLAEKQHEDN